MKGLGSDNGPSVTRPAIPFDASCSAQRIEQVGALAVGSLLEPLVPFAHQKAELIAQSQQLRDAPVQLFETLADE